MDLFEDLLLCPQISMDVDDTPIELNLDQINNASRGSDTEEDPIPIEEKIKILLELENFDPAQIPVELTNEELVYKENLFKDGPDVQYLRVHCTACNTHLGTAPVNQFDRYIHPMLNVILCKECYEFYCSGEFDKDEDGSEMYCRWCGQGGKVMCCSDCTFVFCQKCVRQNLGTKTLALIRDSDNWQCFVCNPSQLMNLKLTCEALFHFTKNEIRIAKLTNQSDNLRVDHALCCKPRVPVAKERSSKRKRISLKELDLPYNPMDDILGIDSKRRKKEEESKLRQILQQQQQAQNSIDPENEVKEESYAVTNTAEVSSSTATTGEEAQLVCTPDLPTIKLKSLESLSDKPRFVPIQPMPPNLQAAKSTDQKKAIVLCTQKPISNNTTPQNRGQLNKQTTSSAKVGVQNNIPSSQKSQVAASTISKSITPTKVTNSSNNISKRTPTSTTTTTTSNNKVTTPRVKTSTPRPRTKTTGSKNKWFTLAYSTTNSIISNLTTKLQSLDVEQFNSVTIEQLAGIHNRLQELLSSSVNNLIQVRRNLRNEFLTDLNILRVSSSSNTLVRPVDNSGASNAFPGRVSSSGANESSTTSAAIPSSSTDKKKLDKSSEPITIDHQSDDDDIILITHEDDPLAMDSTSSREKIPRTAPSVPFKRMPIHPITNGITEEIDLCDDDDDVVVVSREEPFEVVPIEDPSDVSREEPSEEIEKEDSKIEEEVKSTADINSTKTIDEDKNSASKTSVSKIEKSAPNKESTSNDDYANVDPITQLQIQRALAESKLEAIIETNSKIRVDDSISPEELKRILSVRVCVSLKKEIERLERYSSSKKSNLSSDDETSTLAVMEDFEEMLSGSFVLNKSLALPRESNMDENRPTDSIDLRRLSVDSIVGELPAIPSQEDKALIEDEESSKLLSDTESPNILKEDNDNCELEKLDQHSSDLETNPAAKEELEIGQTEKTNDKLNSQIVNPEDTASLNCDSLDQNSDILNKPKSKKIRSPDSSISDNAIDKSCLEDSSINDCDNVPDGNIHISVPTQETLNKELKDVKENCDESVDEAMKSPDDNKKEPTPDREDDDSKEQLFENNVSGDKESDFKEDLLNTSSDTNSIPDVNRKISIEFNDTDSTEYLLDDLDDNSSYYSNNLKKSSKLDDSVSKDELLENPDDNISSSSQTLDKRIDKLERSNSKEDDNRDLDILGKNSKKANHSDIEDETNESVKLLCDTKDLERKDLATETVVTDSGIEVSQ